MFDYQAGRSGEHARNFLGDWQGHLLVDDYAGYKALFTQSRESVPPCTELGCMAHARRKFPSASSGQVSTCTKLTRVRWRWRP